VGSCCVPEKGFSRGCFFFLGGGGLLVPVVDALFYCTGVVQRIIILNTSTNLITLK